MPDFEAQGQTLGAVYLGAHRTRFRVWAPLAEQIELRLLTPQERTLPMTRSPRGYWQTVVDGVDPGALYVYRLNGVKDRPDPASHFQPDGINGPSMVVAPDFAWQDADWHDRPFAQYIIYELHIGTFSPEGTFEGAIQYLPELKALGITAIELMPIAQFSGPRNWGYDGVGLFAPHNSYGGPEGLRKLVDACHREGLAVILDVVYNHLGVEGNYLGDYGPYFTDRYQTVWGSAVNFDGPGSDGVRRYFVENVVYWFRDFHVDALRLDATDAIMDASAQTFFDDLGAAVGCLRDRLKRPLYLTAENDVDDPRVVLPTSVRGYGFDAQWCDDFHHAVHTLLTHESDSYYQDFMLRNKKPTMGYLTKVLREGYAYTGQYSQFRTHRRGRPAREIPAHQFVVFAQNHDQVGNRMLGDRLSTRVSFERLKLGAGIVLLSPYVPLLFMGEEYGETSPFPYFVSHSDPDLIEAIRQGRRATFGASGWQGEVPDPSAEETFLRAKLCRQDAETSDHQILRDFYGELIRLRKTVPALRLLSKEQLDVQGYEKELLLYMRRWDGPNQVWMAFNFNDQPISVDLPVPLGHWHKLMDSTDPHWQASREYLVEPSVVPLGGSATPVFGALRDIGAPTDVPPLLEQVSSDGTVRVNLASSSFVLYTMDAAN